MIFRVSRVSLDSINRPVNIEKQKKHGILEKNLRLSRKRLFGFILFHFCFILFYEDD
jgi:hypothetical protein